MSRKVVDDIRLKFDGNDYDGVVALWDEKLIVSDPVLDDELKDILIISFFKSGHFKECLKLVNKRIRKLAFVSGDKSSEYKFLFTHKLESYRSLGWNVHEYYSLMQYLEIQEGLVLDTDYKVLSKKINRSIIEPLLKWGVPISIFAYIMVKRLWFTYESSFLSQTLNIVVLSLLVLLAIWVLFFYDKAVKVFFLLFTKVIVRIGFWKKW